MSNPLLRSLPLKTGSASREVLVICDEPSARSPLEDLLLCRGYGVTQPAASHQALGQLGGSDPWLVLIDVKKARLGVHVLKVVRRRWPRTAVVILSADGRTDVAMETIAEGASDFLLKPVGPEVLDRVLERY